MKSNKSLFGLFLVGLILLPGCLHVPTYKGQSVHVMSSHSAYQDIENNVIMQVKLLSQEEQKALFGERSILIHENDIQVIHFSIHNVSNLHYSFSPADIDLAMISYRDIKKLMKTNSIGGFASGVGFGAISAKLIDLGVAGPMVCQSMIVAYVAFPLSIVATALTFVFFGKSIKSMIMNHRINKDLAKKTLYKKIIIKPGDHYDGFIFVKQADYNSQFKVSLYEKNNKENSVAFDVDLRKSDLSL